MELSALCKQHHFTLTGIREVPGTDAVLVQMVYDKTGTELCWYKSQESNKLFSIAFKTIPEDDTGVFHILEHSVLCGSDKYPVKEPFVELLKSSMNTFLNAMTFPDKTMYPVSSRNEQDFLNLTSVYLDAVFAPVILTNPNIYRQEGWHYEEADGQLTYNGVVFNEMKGAMSSVDQVVYRGIQMLVYPDNGYRYNSGGDPAAIPNLTYQQFVDTYKRNYHPTNARIYLDGDIPAEKVLAMLDGYLSRYEMGEKQTIAMQPPVSLEKTLYYEAVEDGTPKAQYVMGKLLGTFEDKTGLMARQVLCDVLCGSNDAPLKRAVLQTQLCQDVSMEINDGLIQPFMALRLHNMEDKDAAQLEAVVRQCAAKLVQEGISREQLIASINRFAFKVQQMEEPQGLIRCINSMNTWLYDGDPMEYLHYEDSVVALREMVKSDGFEKLLSEMLCDETGMCRLHVLPSQTHGAQLREAEIARLAKEKAAFSEAQLEDIRATAAALSQWQQTPDSPEQLATLPVLNLSEISPEPTLCPTQIQCVDGVTVLRHKAPSNGIVHLTAYFRLTDCSLEQLTQLSLLSRLLGNLPTKTMDAAKLQNEIKTYVGDLKFAVEVNAKCDQRAVCTPTLTVRCSVLKENLQKAEELIHQILTGTDLRQPDRIREIILQAETELQQRGMMGGHMLAANAVQSHFSAVGAVQEALSGFTPICYVHKLSKNFETELESFTATLENTLAAAVCKARLTLSVTEDGHCDISGLLALLEQGTPAPEAAAYQTALPKKLGIRIPAQVSYASTGCHLSDTGTAYHGTARLISNILSLGYLWNEVRVQGGAYGAGMRISKSGNLFTYSYRDPSPARTLNVNRSMADFLQQVSEAGQDITGYIISSVAETEPLVGPADQGRIADNNYFAGFGYEQAAAERKQLLEATCGQLTDWCKVLNSINADAPVCVVGYADALAGCKDENLTVMDI